MKNLNNGILAPPPKEPLPYEPKMVSPVAEHMKQEYLGERTWCDYARMQRRLLLLDRN